MLRINQCKVNIDYTMEDVKKKAASILKIKPSDIRSICVLKESLDARKKPNLFYSLTLDVEVNQEETVLKRCRSKDVVLQNGKDYAFPNIVLKENPMRPVIVGAGPAGLVCAYYLAKAGLRPILLERGKCVEERQKDVERFWNTGVLHPESNVQFGEGGAGTFSDGKLNTLIKDKDGRCREILKLFAQMGAPSDIVYKQKPHVGTDILISMVKNLRTAICNAGGQVRFQSKVTDVVIRDDKVAGVVINEEETIETDCVVLSIGHSARDTFQMLLEKDLTMEPKAFAVGYRVQHKQELIDLAQYGEQENDIRDILGPASYKLTAQTSSGRGVYSFCMCPGGYVVNASSESERLAVNGMSYRDRDSGVANSAIIVAVTPEDFRDKGPLGGVEFQRELEMTAYGKAGGDIPLQTYGDYKANRPSLSTGSDLIAVKGKASFANLRGILPNALEDAFIEAMEQFGRKIPGFDNDLTWMAGIESRTSSPVRIVRDTKGMAKYEGIYPCGEGAGYAGGITSAAMDGLLIAEKIAYAYSVATQK